MIQGSIEITKNICSKCSWTAVWGHVVFVEYGLYMKYIVHVRGVSRPWIHCMFYSQGAIMPFCRVWSPYMESMDLFTGCYALYTPVVCLSVTRVWSLYGVYVRGVSSANGEGAWHKYWETLHVSLLSPPHFLDIFTNIFTNIFLISSQISSQYIFDICTNIFLICSQISSWYLHKYWENSAPLSSPLPATFSWFLHITALM